jgi:transcriptional regulator with XRE-family HTH domain
MLGVGEIIYRLRNERNLTIEMLAIELNARYHPDKPVNVSMISRWENNINDPTLENARLLCDYFGVSLDYLIGLTDVRTPSRLLAYKRGNKGGEPK